MKKQKISFKWAAVVFIAAFMLILSSCGKNEATEEFFAMDTFMSIKVCGNDAVNLAKKSKDIVLECERKYSNKIQGSEVYDLNEKRSIENCSDGLKEMLTYSKTMWELTEGKYDLTVGKLLDAWSFSEGGRLPSDDEITEALGTVGFDNIIMEGNKITLKGKGKLDLGSCAKGYAGQKVAEMLKEQDIKYGIISLGGNVVTVGSKGNGKNFRIGIADPFRPAENMGILETEECSVVTSGTYQRNFTLNGKTYHHILDAVTGRPSENGLVSITVVADDSTKADILSTALFLMGTEKAEEFRKKDGNFEYIAVDKKGNVVVSEGLTDVFELSK